MKGIVVRLNVFLVSQNMQKPVSIVHFLLSLLITGVLIKVFFVSKSL